jgi:hypothetical protein
MQQGVRCRLEAKVSVFMDLAPPRIPDADGLLPSLRTDKILCQMLENNI